MSNRKKQEEIAFNRIYSRFKLQIFFTRRMAITHYGQERYHCTVAQINYKHVQQVILNRQRGLEDCIARLQLCTELYGPYQTALIYDRRRDTRMPDGKLQIGKEIRKYVGGQLVEWDEIVLPEYEKNIVCDVVHKNDKWVLRPINLPPSPIDFKTEITNALQQPTSGNN